MIHKQRLMRSLYALLAVALVLASCMPTDTSAYGWCYEFDFATHKHGFVLEYETNELLSEGMKGDWAEGVGFYSTDLGFSEQNLSFSYQHDEPLAMAGAEMIIGRGFSTDTTYSLIFSGYGNVFGTSYVTSSGFVPGGYSEFPAVIDAHETLDNSQFSFNFETDSNAEFSVKSLKVFGYGGNPFGDSNCLSQDLPLVTPITPDPPTSTQTAPPSNTPLPTFTPSHTYTPSHTPVPTWCYRFDFTASDGGWAQRSANEGSWSTGIGWVNGQDGTITQSRRLVVNRTFTASTFTEAKFEFEYVRGIDNNGVDDRGGVVAAGVNNYNTPILSFPAPYSTGSHTTTWTGLLNFNQVQFNLWSDNTASSVAATGSVTLTAATFKGTGSSPFGDNCSPTPTPTSTHTPTNTPDPATSTPSRTMPPTHTAPPGVSTASRTPLSPNTRTPVPTNTRTITNTPGPSLTPSASRTMIPPPTGFMTATLIPYTPDPTYLTPDGTSFMTATPSPGSGGDEDSGEWFLIDQIGQFFNWVQNTITGIIEGIGQFFMWIEGTIANIVGLIGDLLHTLQSLLDAILRFIAELIEIGRMIIEIIIRILQLIVGWVVQMFGRLGNLLTAFYTAPQTAIPGLPQCYSNPTASDLCALYYILDWTILAPGTPGQIIMPLVLFLMDARIFFYVIGFGFKLIRRGEKITSVG